MATWLDDWRKDKKKRDEGAVQDPKTGKVNFKEASRASQIQTTLPNYQGQNAKEGSKSYQWETDLLKPLSIKGYGRSYTDKFNNWARSQGLSPSQAEEYRRRLDFEEDRNQKYKPKSNGDFNTQQAVRPGQGAMLQNDLIDSILKAADQQTQQKIQANKYKEINKAKQEAEIAQKTNSERNGLLGFLDSTLGRAGDAAHKFSFGDEFVKKQNEAYRDHAVNKLLDNPDDKKAIQSLKMLSTTDRTAKNNLEKVSDFLGATSGAIAPYTVGGAYGAADAILGKVGLNSIKSPIVKDLVRGIGAGAIAGSERELAQKLASNKDISAKNIALESALAGGGDVALGALLRNLNLKGQLQHVMDGTGSKKYNAAEFEKALKEAYGQKGNPTNVLAHKVPDLPNPVDKVRNVSVSKKTMDDFNPSNLPDVKLPPVLDDWFNFAQSGKGPKARGQQSVNAGRYTKEALSKQADDILKQADSLKNAPKGGYNQRLLEVQKQMQEASTQIPPTPKDDWINFGQSSANMPKARFNPVTEAPSSPDPLNRGQQYWQQRYEEFAQQVNKNYNPNNLSDDALSELWTQFAKREEPVSLHQAVDLAYGPPTQPKEPFDPVKRLSELLANKQPVVNRNVDDLYNAVRQEGDPASFDELIKLAEMEHNAATAPKDLTKLLRDDPKVNEEIRKLNELLGVKPKQSVQPTPFQPNTNFDEALALLNDVDKGPGVNLPNGNTLKLPDLGSKGNGNAGTKNGNLLEQFDNVLKGKEKPKQPTPKKDGMLLSLKDVGMPEPKATTETVKPAPAVKEAAEKPIKLKTMKTEKEVSKMSKDELETVYRQLVRQRESLSGKGKEQHVKAIEEDIAQVEDMLMRLDLQTFGKNEPKPKPNNDNTELYQQKNDKLKSDLEKLLENSDEWKDKGKFFLGRETMERNFEDIMGKDAGAFKEKFLDPIKGKEADRVRFLNQEREIVKNHGIKPKSEDDKLVQMYGEKKITLDELKQKTPNWEKVVEVSDAYRKKYDELLDTVNKELTANGFSEIPKRKDYFPHYEEMDGLLKQFGFDVHNNTLPTDINGLTDNFKPTKTFFNNALRRKGEETTFGAIQGFDRYIEGASNLIYHTKNIKQLRTLEKQIRTKYEGNTHLSNFVAELGEYTNLLAGKKAKVDRAFEDRFGRGVYNAVDTIRRRTGANMIGANLASAMTNYIPLTQSLATTNKRAFVKGMMETLANVVKNDGFIQKSDFLTKRIGSDPLYRTTWDKIVDKSMWFMKTSDAFVSQAITRGKYNELISKGLPEKEAIKKADDYATRIMAARSKGEMPTLFGSKTLGIASQFQLEVNNQVSVLFKDIPKNAKNKAALASSIGQVLLYSYAFNELYEKAVGRRPAFDPIGIAFQAKKDYTNDKLSKGEATQRTTENILNTLPFTSLLNGGRFPISAGVPNVNDAMNGRSPWSKELAKPLIYLGLPAGGGQLKKAYEGLTAMGHNPLSPQENAGVYQNGKLKIPVKNNAANNIRAPLFGQYSFPETKEYYDINNRPAALSEMQTKAYERLEKRGKGRELYDFLRLSDAKKSDKAKVTKIEKDEKLSADEKFQKLLDILQNVK